MIKSSRYTLFILLSLSLLALPSLVMSQGNFSPWSQFQTNRNHIGYYAEAGVINPAAPAINLTDPTIIFREVWDPADPLTPVPPATAVAGQASPPVVDSSGYVYQLVNDDTGFAKIRRISTTMESNCKVWNELEYFEASIPLNNQTFNNISPALDEINQLIYFVSNQGYAFAYSLQLQPVWGPYQVGREVRCSPTFDSRADRNRLYIVSNEDVDLDGILEGKVTCFSIQQGDIGGVTITQLYAWSPQDPLALDPYYESYFSSPVAVATVSDGINTPVDHVYVLGLVDDNADGDYSVNLYAIGENPANPGTAIMDWFYPAERETIGSIIADTYQYCAVTIIPDVFTGGMLCANLYFGTRSGLVFLIQDQFLAVDDTITPNSPFDTTEEISGSFAMDGRYLYVMTDESIFLLLRNDLTADETYGIRGGNLFTSPAVDRNGVIYFASGTLLRAIYPNPDATPNNFFGWNVQPSVGGTLSSPVIGFLVDKSGGASGGGIPPNPIPSYAVYIVESTSSTIFAFEQNTPPRGGDTAGVLGLDGGYGNRLNNNMGKPATVFTYAALSMTEDGEMLDPDCDDIADVELRLNYRLEYLANMKCFYNGMPNNPGGSNRSAIHPMLINPANRYYEYVTAATELEGGQHSYYVIYTDEFDADFSTETVNGRVNGPNMCPELDEIIPNPNTITSNGLEVRAEYEGNLTQLTLRILYFDIDHESPAVKDVYILGDPYDMTYVRSGNEYQSYCDFYTINTLIPSADPFFYFQFEDSTSTRGTMACSVKYPEVGVFYPLKLSEPTVSPDVGDSSEIYTFSVRFFSPFNMAPDEAKVLINDDSVGNNMTLVPGSGSPGNGVYQFVTSPGVLGTGLNTYAFIFSNNKDLDPNDLNEYVARTPMGSNVYTGPAISPWPVYRHDRMHSGKSSSSGSVIPPVPDFDYFQTGDAIPGSAVVDWDGKIYFGSRDKKFYCLMPDLTLDWSYDVGNWIDSSPTLGPDGTVIFPCRDNNIYCLKATDLQGGSTEANSGNERFLWKYSAQGISGSSPVIAPNGNIIVGSSYGFLYALKKNGTTNWIYNTGKASIDGSPVVSSNGTIFFGATDSNLYAL
ncbi:PQQ-binding-like beta-propeller repeat protein, partial [bacterium]|nr:PQQ-binding-like beta-propeller repeat protein [bacterium]